MNNQHTEQNMLPGDLGRSTASTIVHGNINLRHVGDMLQSMILHTSSTDNIILVISSFNHYRFFITPEYVGWDNRAYIREITT